MNKVKLSEADKNRVYQRGFEDGKAGKFSPPKGDTLTDIVFSPITAITGEPSTKKVAEAEAAIYRTGHSAGAHSRDKR